MKTATLATAFVALATLATPSFADDRNENRSAREQRSAARQHKPDHRAERHEATRADKKDQHGSAQEQRQKHRRGNHPDSPRHRKHPHPAHARNGHHRPRPPHRHGHPGAYNHRYDYHRSSRHRSGRWARPYYNPYAWRAPRHFREPRHSIYFAYDLAWDHFGLNVERALFEHGHWVLFGFSAMHGPLRVIVDSATGVLLSYHPHRRHH